MVHFQTALAVEADLGYLNVQVRQTRSQTSPRVRSPLSVPPCRYRARKVSCPTTCWRR